MPRSSLSIDDLSWGDGTPLSGPAIGLELAPFSSHLLTLCSGVIHGGQIAQRTVRPKLIILLPPGLDLGPGILDRQEPVRLSDQTDQPFRSKVTKRFGAWLPAISV